MTYPHDPHQPNPYHQAQPPLSGPPYSPGPPPPGYYPAPQSPPYRQTDPAARNLMNAGAWAIWLMIAVPLLIVVACVGLCMFGGVMSEIESATSR